MSDKVTIGWRLGAIFLFALVAIILVPFLLRLPGMDLGILGDTGKVFAPALGRSIGVALFAALFIVGIAFLLALFMVGIPAFSRMGNWLAILILPITLGNLSIAFLCKVLFGDTAYFNAVATGDVTGKLAFLLLLHGWQYGILFTYLFWLNFQSIPGSVLDYSRATGFTRYQRIKDIYLPRSRNLIIMLSSILFLFTVYEESKLQYLFKPSPGTGSELVAHWLSRSYQSMLVAGPDKANDLAFGAGATTFLAVLVVLTILFLFVHIAMRTWIRSNRYPATNTVQDEQRTSTGRSAQLIALLLIALVLVPVAAALIVLPYLAGSDIGHLWPSFIMTLIATLVAGSIAIGMGMAVRVGWKERLSSFSPRSLPFFLGLVALLLVPPLLVLLSGYAWMGQLGYSWTQMIWPIWVAGHMLLTKPLLGSFVLFSHFRVSTNELDYLQLHGLSKWEIAKTSFLQRFKAEYLLLFILAFSFIWNEGVVNNLFSDFIPSFAANLKMLITGRAADLQHAAAFLWMSIALSLVSVALWFAIVRRGRLQPLAA
jgi:ABC-type Fe3+ transport system permease subunit